MEGTCHLDDRVGETGGREGQFGDNGVKERETSDLNGRETGGPNEGETCDLDGEEEEKSDLDWREEETGSGRDRRA
jgi:hypothetical protein